MDINELRFILETARCGSISMAAKKLFMAQPNLSRLIRLAEEEYGITIFERVHSGVIPTVEGTEFLKHANSVVREMEALRDSCAPTKRRLAGISISTPRASYISECFCEYIADLDARSVGIMRYEECSSAKAIRNLRERDYGLAIIRYATGDEQYYLALTRLERLCLKPIAEFTYRILVSKRNPLAGMESVTQDDLAEFIQILHGDEIVPGTKWMPEKSGSERSLNLNRKVFVTERGSQFGMISRMPNAYMLVSPMPESILSLSDLGFVQIRLESPKRVLRDALVYKERHVFTREEKDFLSTLRSRMGGEFDIVFDESFPS